jgi:hypothetical protein
MSNIPEEKKRIGHDYNSRDCYGADNVFPPTKGGGVAVFRNGAVKHTSSAPREN